MNTLNLFQSSLYRFKRLRSDWPSHPHIDWKQVKRRFLALLPEEQGHCSRLAVRYVRLCQRTGSHLISPSQRIEARGWRDYLEAERSAAREFEAKSTPVWVVEGTAA
ncbi:hypothetical protein [Microvirga aerophila]|uniref:Uncharacterized protein n=1 Tax=Microvirga aerophila TaxID=670291 RepID=A0A512BZS5_9HYPH|nr:hypothetical protein [Microvirga aerophila]GEO17453.1 hypothetical protein MAE02_51490 [Microvirga aerophila]